MKKPTLAQLLGDWCYQVTVKTADGHVAHPNIQAPDEDECRKRIEGLYGDAEIVAIDPVHRTDSKLHHEPAIRIFRPHVDGRPVERRISVRRRPVLG